MFMLRCVFWLSVMFASLPAATGIVGTWPGAAGKALQTAALEQAGTWCAARPGQCARDASRLTALVVASAGASGSRPEERIRTAFTPEVPSRHRAAKTVLTNGR